MAARGRDSPSDGEDTDVSDEYAAPAAPTTRSWRQRLSQIVHPGAVSNGAGHASTAAAPPEHSGEYDGPGADGPVPAPSAALARFGHGSHLGLRAAEDETIARGLATRRTFLQTPIAEDAQALQCYVTRDRSGTHRLSPLFTLHLENGDGFLAAARKRLQARTAHIAITADPAGASSDRAHALGKLRANFVGSEYVAYDSGIAPGKTVDEHSVRRELAGIQFAYGELGPGRMTAVVPAVSSALGVAVWRDSGSREHRSSLLATALSGQRSGLIVLQNKRPRWDARAEGHVLNFHGRVTVSSVKNFQLQEKGGERTVLQYGRVGRDRFTMDVAYPLSPLQGFAICLASVDRKWAEHKTYERYRTWRGAKGGTHGESEDSGAGSEDEP